MKLSRRSREGRRMIEETSRALISRLCLSIGRRSREKSVYERRRIDCKRGLLWRDSLVVALFHALECARAFEPEPHSTILVSREGSPLVVGVTAIRLLARCTCANLGRVSHSRTHVVTFRALTVSLGQPSADSERGFLNER